MTLFGLFGSAKTVEIQTPLDLVTHTAGLASNPADIDVLLDKVRAITVTLAPGQIPSAADVDKLIAIYLQLESYLTTKEPIRVYTRKDLRARVSPQLLQTVAEFEAKNNGKDAPSTGVKV